MSPGLPRIREKLNHLFETVPQPSGAPYTSAALAAELGARGIEVTAAHVRGMRTGRAENPSAVLLGGIAEVFGVPVGYFYDEDKEREVNAQLEALAALRDLKAVRLRGQLDPQSLIEVIEVVRRLQELEGRDE